MKITRISHRKNWLLTLVMTLLISSITAYGFHNELVKASPATTMYIDPPSIIDTTKTAGTTITITLKVSEVEDVISWSCLLNFDPDILNTTLAQIIEGPFLSSVAPEGTFFIRKVFNDQGYIDLACSILGDYHGPSGSGLLATVTFNVRALGETDLDLNTTKMLDFYVEEIPHTAEDGFFSNLPAGGTISGTVKDASTNLAISGATVEATGPQTKSTTTGADGKYTISALSAGSYSVKASKTGYQDQTKPATVTAGQTTTVDFLLTPLPTTGTISGTVKDASTTLAISGATVTAVGPQTKSATTAADGTYTISNLQPGSYSVTASKAGYQDQTKPATVTAGVTTTLNFDLTQIPVVTYDLTISVEGSGTTDPAPGVHTYDEGTVVSVDAIPAAGWSLDHWELDTVDVGSADPYSVTMDADHALKAVFAEIPEDTTPPTITITEPTARDYLHSETLTLDFSVVDTQSGVASVLASLDGVPVEDGDSFELYMFSLGTHTFVVNAVDKAGNSATKTVTFNIIATVDSLQDLVTMFYKSGFFYSPKGIYTSLIQKLNAAEAYIDDGLIDDAKGVLGAFINELRAQSDKHVSSVAANTLIADAQYVIAHLDMNGLKQESVSNATFNLPTPVLFIPLIALSGAFKRFVRLDRSLLKPFN